jgi:hypothetical protein
MAIPIYYSFAGHRIRAMNLGSSYINLNNFDINEAFNKITTFELNYNFIDNYVNAQISLNNLFSSNLNLMNERFRVSKEISKELENIL